MRDHSAATAASYAATDSLHAGDLSLSLSPSTGGLAFAIGGHPWFVSANGSTALKVAGAWHVSGSTLRVASIRRSNGSDALGSFEALSIKYEAATTQAVRMRQVWRAYSSLGAMALEHIFEAGSPWSPSTRPGVGSLADLSTAGLIVRELAESLTVLAYQGGQLQDTLLVSWPRGAPLNVPPSIKSPQIPYAGAPFVAYDRSGTALAIGPLDEFFSTTCRPAASLPGALFACGAHGAVGMLPASWSHGTMIFARRRSHGGVHAALTAYGDALLTAGGRKRREATVAAQARDLPISTLGYYTDNGAYYYYTTAPSRTADGETLPPACNVTKSDESTPRAGCLTYEATMQAALAHHRVAGLPSRYLQLDSWWYWKEDGSKGILEWRARGDAFPSGMRPAAVAGAPLVLHARYFSPLTPYTSRYAFLLQEGDEAAIPVDPSFFPDLFKPAVSWGMRTYEQDFLITAFEKNIALRRNISAARTWLRLMDAAAHAANVSIQYCMALDRFLLQSTTMPAVLSARASNDYNPCHYGDDQWSYVPVTSLLIGAVGLAPFKDVFWSVNATQRGNRWGDACVEADPSLNLLTAILSSGPVASGDRIGLANISALNQSCRADGMLLRPDQPAVPLPLAMPFLEAGNVIRRPALYPVAASSRHEAGVWFYLLATRMAHGSLVHITPAELGGPSSTHAELLSVDYHALLAAVPTLPRGTRESSAAADSSGHLTIRIVTTATPLPLPAPAASPDGQATPYSLTLLAPVPPRGARWALLGERAKVVAAARQRFASVRYVAAASTMEKGEKDGDPNSRTGTPLSLRVTVVGAPAENIQLLLLRARTTSSASEDPPPLWEQAQLVLVVCKLDAGSAAAQLVCGANEASCTCASGRADLLDHLSMYDE